MAHKFDPANMDKLLEEDRLGNMTAHDFLTSLGLKKDMVFADIGAGPGFFSLPAAQIVGEHGMVIATDTSMEMINALKERDPGNNVVTMHSSEYFLPIEPEKVDVALLAFVLHEVEDMDKFINVVKGVVKKEGLIYVLDWIKQGEARGPEKEERLEEKMAAAVLGGNGLGVMESKHINGSYYLIKAEKL